MTEIVTLRPDEAVFLDVDRLDRLVNDLGPAEAEAVAQRALDEITRRLEQMRVARTRQDRLAFAGLARSLARVAGQVGCESLVHAARAAGVCAMSGDEVAHDATWARLDRLAARTCATAWDLCGVSG